MLRRQPMRHISEKRRLVGDLFDLNTPIRKRMKRMIELSNGGMP